MFLDRCAELGLLVHDENTNILGPFSLTVKKVVVSQVVTFLLNDVNTGGILTTPSHVQWAMESVGQGFGLPIEEEAVIKSCIQLYRRWLLEDKQPKPIQQDGDQLFLQNILMHYSLLFNVKKRVYTENGSLETHAILCTQVLDIFVIFAREKGSTLTANTWEVWLNLMLGITDHLFTAPPGEEKLGVMLAAKILKTLIELLLLSHTQNPATWQTLKNLYVNWSSNLMPAILQWNATSLALTKRVIALLYGESEGTPSVSIRLNDVTTVNLNDQHTFYAWHRILHIAGNPNNLVDPKIFLEAMKGIKNLVDTFLGVGKTGKKICPPDGNTILHIFGAWLFEAIKVNRNGFDEGTSLAVEILCDIFHFRRTTKFQPIYLASFYSCLGDVLLQEGRVLVSALLHTKEFFMDELEGSRILTPHFVYALAGVLTRNHSPFNFIVSFEQVRNACIQIAGSLLCVSNFFGSAKLSSRLTKEHQAKLESILQTEVEPSKMKTFPEITTYSALTPYMAQMLLKGMRTETYSSNIEQLLWCTIVHQNEIVDDPNSSDFAHSALEIIVNKITAVTSWSARVTLTAFKTLSGFATFYSKIAGNSQEASHVVMSLSTFIIHRSQEEDPPHNIIVGAFDCITDWIMADQWIIGDIKSLRLLLCAIVIGLGQPSKRFPSGKVYVPTSESKQAAHYCLVNLLNNTGHYPSAAGARRASTLVTEEELLHSIEVSLKQSDSVSSGEDVKQYVRYFLLNRSILTVVDNPFTEGGPTTTVLIRDQSGKYSWNTQLIYVPENEKEALEQTKKRVWPKNPVVHAPFVPKPSGRPLVDDSFKDLFEFLDGHTRSDNIISLTEKQVKHEEDYLQTKQYGLNYETQISAPVSSALQMYNGPSKFQLSRLLLNHLGFLNLDTKDKIYQLDNSPGFFSSLKVLDQLPERHVQKIGVLYIAEGQRTEQEVFQNVGGSDEYQKFLTGLGWGIDISTHPGFTGGLDRNSALTGTAAPYYATYSTETVFQVSTLMPTPSGEAEQITLRNLVAKNHVVIVWMEDDVDVYRQFQNFLKTNEFHIIIHPLGSGLCQTRIIANNPDAKNVGPLWDNMIISQEALPGLVRATAMNAHFKVSGVVNKPYAARKDIIEDVISKFKRDEPLQVFYTSLFTAIRAPNTTNSTSPTFPLHVQSPIRQSGLLTPPGVRQPK